MAEHHRRILAREVHARNPPSEGGHLGRDIKVDSDGLAAELTQHLRHTAYPDPMDGGVEQVTPVDHDLFIAGRELDQDRLCLPGVATVPPSVEGGAGHGVDGMRDELAVAEERHSEDQLK